MKRKKVQTEAQGLKKSLVEVLKVDLKHINLNMNLLNLVLTKTPYAYEVKLLKSNFPETCLPCLSSGRRDFSSSRKLIQAI